MYNLQDVVFASSIAFMIGLFIGLILLKPSTTFLDIDRRNENKRR